MINCTNLVALPTKAKIMTVTRVIDFVFIRQACEAVIYIMHKKD